MKNKKVGTVEITKHSAYETSYEEPEAVEEQKRVLGMIPRKTYEEAKKSLPRKVLN